MRLKYEPASEPGGGEEEGEGFYQEGHSPLPWREASPPNHHDDTVDSDQ